MEGFCRGCLIKYDDTLELLQYTEKNRRLFVYSTGLQVKRNDTFTFQLCKNCYLNMKLACKFKKLCRTSDKRFKNYITLKEVDDSLEFCSFLKQNDDNFNFRFPLMSGNSTPANQKSKDDDNESTCTSIRNFMTDMLQGEEMPDTEARIIKEVIEEEADVIDDSLDSHWLQDDVSIDTDFRLDFSFSPFSTPRSNKNDSYDIPIKSSKEKKQEELNYYTSKAIIEKPDHIDELNIIDEAIKNIPNNDSENIFNELHESPKNNLDLVDVDNVKSEINAQNFYVQRDIFDDNLNSIIDDAKVGDKNDQCTIDRNLEKALKNESADKFSLDDLLASPPVFQNSSGQMTPTIANILFSEKIDSSSPINQNMGQCIEKFQNVEGHDNLDGFFNDNKDYDPDVVLKETLDNDYQNENEDFITAYELENKNAMNPNGMSVQFEKVDQNDSRDILAVGKNFDIESFYCKLCEKKFTALRSLRLHVTKRHKIRIVIKGNIYIKHKDNICEICGKIFKHRANIIRHRKTHKTHDPNTVYECDICRIVCTNQIKLDQHKKIHNPQAKDEVKKKYMCNICGKWSSTRTNFILHQRRHTKSYKFYCTDCGKGFYRTTDLTNHKRYHTYEKPFQCPHCDSKFTQRTGLVQHVKKIHLGEKYFQCDCCNVKYKKKKELIKHLKKEQRKRKRNLNK